MTAYVLRISVWSSDVCSSDLSSSFESAFSTTWQPEKAPTGPVSIILSASDERAVVLRNGIEIGSTPIAIRGRISGLQAFTLSSIDQHGTHWMYLPLLGSARAGEVSRQERAADTARGVPPESFDDPQAGKHAYCDSG